MNFPESRSPGVLEYRSPGMLEYRSTGVPEYRNTGMPASRNHGVPESWNPGITEQHDTLNMDSSDGGQHELECVIGGESQQHSREDFDPGGCDRSLDSEVVESGDRYVAPEQTFEPAMPLDIDTPSAGRSLVDIGVAYGRGISSDDDASDGGKAIRGCPEIHEGQARCLDCKGLEPRAWSSLGIEEAQIGSVSGTGEGRSGIG